MNKEEQENFEGLLDIDKTRLDDEAEDQPKKVWIYGKMLAKAIRAWDDAIAKFKLAEADADAAVRDHPSKFGLEKVTEMGVKRAILRNKAYQAANEAVNLAKYRVCILEAAVKSLDHRRTSLSMLDGQDTRNYFSRPTQKERVDVGKSIHRKPLRQKV
jgi:hypothetical protein